MTSITPTTFNGLVQIQNYTTINSMVIRYLAVDPAFPHHLNSFDNVPINYQAGSLVLILIYSGQHHRRYPHLRCILLQHDQLYAANPGPRHDPY